MTIQRLLIESRPLRVVEIHPLFSGNDDLPALLPAHGQRVKAVLVRAWFWLGTAL